MAVFHSFGMFTRGASRTFWNFIIWCCHPPWLDMRKRQKLYMWIKAIEKEPPMPGNGIFIPPLKMAKTKGWFIALFSPHESCLTSPWPWWRVCKTFITDKGRLHTDIPVLSIVLIFGWLLNVQHWWMVDLFLLMVGGYHFFGFLVSGFSGPLSLFPKLKLKFVDVATSMYRLLQVFFHGN